MERVPVVSSNIHSVGYDPDTETLQIQFKTKNGGPGYVYNYPGIPASKHEDLMTAKSKGKFFAMEIKPLTKGERIEE